MANTLTDLIPDAYAAMDVVSRELVGMIPAVSMDATANRAAKNQKVRTHVVPQSNALEDVTPAMAVPAAADQTIGNVYVEITKSKVAAFSWEGNEQDGLNNGGAGYGGIRVNQIAQAMRSLTNAVEADLCALHTKFSRAYGTAGATPFNTAGDFTDASEVLRILKDNGAPQSDNHLVFNTAAGAKMLGKQAKVNEAGTDSILRQGVLLDVNGMALRESAQINTSTAGTASGATTNTAGYAIGATVITLASAGTGTIVAGDVITFAGDANKYVVASGDADVSNGGTITLAAPGLRKALAASAIAITVVAAAARNMAFTRSAIVLATRMPERPQEGDMAEDVASITDPRSGLSFEIAMYKGYRKVRYEIGLAWGQEVIKPEHTAILLG